MIKTHKFNGVVYDIDTEEDPASCQEPKPKRPSMYIPMDKNNGKRLLYLCVHEALHACNYKASEDRVENTSQDITRFLWRIGYRLRNEE